MTESHAHAASPMLRALATVAYEAGAIVLAHYTQEITARRKDDMSPVTAADEDAERFILKRLTHLVPGVPIVAEEQSAAGHAPKTGHRFFLVDPLDGTKEFLNRNGEFTINIAEIVEGRPVRGVIYAPAIDRLFFGEVLSGAFEAFAPPGGARTSPKRKKIYARMPANGLVAAVSRTHKDKKTDEYLTQYKVKSFVVSGSSAEVLSGRGGEADIYPRHGQTMEWDTAAGHAILAAAGGESDDDRRQAIPLRQTGLPQSTFRGARTDISGARRNQLWQTRSRTARASRKKLGFVGLDHRNLRQNKIKPACK